MNFYKNDYFTLFHLDRNDPKIKDLVSIWAKAVDNYIVSKKHRYELTDTFLMLVGIFYIYKSLPKEKRMRCFSIIKEVKLMWDDVLDMEIDKLIEACKNIAEGDDDSTNYLCNICMEFIEASSALGSKLNNATEIYRHAVDLATEHIDIPQICSSYLFLLCAHIRSNFIRDMKDYREVELLLSTAILHHFIAVDMNDISKIDHATMYSLHIASAVTDIIRFRTILGKDTSDTTELVREAYRMLRVYAPNRGQKERKSLEEVSGISEKDILDQNSTSDDKKDDLPN